MGVATRPVGERFVELNRSIERCWRGVEAVKHVGGGIGLNVDQELALAGPNFVEGVTDQRHVASQNSFFDIRVWNLESQTHLVVRNSDGVVES